MKTKWFKTKIYMRDSEISIRDGINSLHPTKGPHWVRYIDKYHFASCGCTPLKNFSNSIIQKSKHGLVQETRFKKKIDTVVHIVQIFFQLTKKLKIGFKNAVLHSYNKKKCHK